MRDKRDDIARTASKVAKKTESSSHARNWRTRHSVSFTASQKLKHFNPVQGGGMVMLKEVRVAFEEQKRSVVLVERNLGKLRL